MTTIADRETTILVADDDAIIRELSRAVLEDAGFCVHEAMDGEDALRLCRARRPDLVISDASMPKLDGFELCRRIRRSPEIAHVPVLMATGLDDEDSIRTAYESGATDFIAKPIAWPLLPHRVNYMLRAARAFATLRTSHQELVAANEAKSNFLALVSHELRTPLNAIIGFSTVMRDRILGPLPEAYTSYPADIAESGEHLLSIINSVLDISNAERGSLELDPQETHLQSIGAYIRGVFAQTASDAGVALSVDVPEDLPAIRADPDKLRQVFINLVSNAVKFTPAGGSVRLHVAAENGGLTCRVIDTGIGIPADQIQTALTPFGQVDSRLARKYEGIGLGLPLSKTIAELHGGTLTVESDLGRGTVITVRIPASPETAGP